MLVSFMDGGKHSNVMRQAGDEPLASDNENYEHSPIEEKPEDAIIEKHGISPAVLAANALLQSVKSATLASEYEDQAGRQIFFAVT